MGDPLAETIHDIHVRREAFEEIMDKIKTGQLKTVFDIQEALSVRMIAGLQWINENSPNGGCL